MDDQTSRENLTRMSVRTYLNQVARGHTVWANGNKPTPEAFQDFKNYLGDHPNDPGHLYVDILEEILDGLNDTKENPPRVRMTHSKSITLLEALRPNDLNLPG